MQLIKNGFLRLSLYFCQNRAYKKMVSYDQELTKTITGRNRDKFEASLVQHYSNEEIERMMKKASLQTIWLEEILSDEKKAVSTYKWITIHSFRATNFFPQIGSLFNP